MGAGGPGEERSLGRPLPRSGSALRRLLPRSLLPPLALVAPLLLASPLLLAGCRGGGDDVLEEVERPGDLLALVDGRDNAVAQAAVVRVTPGWVVALCALEGSEPRELFLRFGEERLPAVARPCGEGLAVVEARRGGRRLRPFALAIEADQEAPVLVRPLSGGAWPSRVAALRDEQLLLEPADDAAAWVGGVVVRGSTLVGFVVGVEGAETGRAQPLVRGLQRDLGRCLASVCATPGADCLAPGDEFSALELAIRVPERLPLIADEWGEGDLFLSLDRTRDQRPVARLPLIAGQPSPPQTVALEALGPLEARLVERDVTLTEGVVDTPLAPPQVISPRAGAARLRFELSEGGELVSLGVRLRVLDPDRASGVDRTLLGAPPFRLGDAVHGTLCLARGDSTDLWRYDPRPRATSAASKAPAPPRQSLLLAYRADPTHVALEGWHPGGGAPVWRIPPEPGAPHFTALRLEHSARDLAEARLWVRARQEIARPAEDPKLGARSSYALAIVPTGEPVRTVELLLELFVGQASGEGTRYLDAHLLGREAFRALRDAAQLPLDELSQALVPSLGHEVPAARLLTLELLDTYLAPDLLALERLRREARRPAAQIDAGLLLVARTRSARRLAEVDLGLHLPPLEGGRPPLGMEELPPVEVYARRVDLAWRALSAAERDALLRACSDALEDYLVLAAGDELPEVRLLAVNLAAGLVEASLRGRLRERLEQRLHRDPSPRVRRALLTAFWAR